jgi:hypothetical protein
MKLLEQEFTHPTQASLVRLRIFQQPEGFLVTEDSQGAATVVRTLGLFDAREEAEASVRSRAAQLAAQGWVVIEPGGAASHPPDPPLASRE